MRGDRRAQRTAALILAATLLAPALSACGEDDEPCVRDAAPSCGVCEAITEPATLQLGGTLGEGDSREFVGLRTGDDLLITFFDFAGLWVSYGSIRAHGIYPGKPDRYDNVEDPRVLLEIFDQSERIGAAATQHLGLTSTEQGAEALGILIVLESERPISELLGNTVTLRGEITDACGNTATDELDLVVACAPDDDHCKGQQ